MTAFVPLGWLVFVSSVTHVWFVWGGCFQHTDRDFSFGGGWCLSTPCPVYFFWVAVFRSLTFFVLLGCLVFVSSVPCFVFLDGCFPLIDFFGGAGMAGVGPLRSLFCFFWGVFFRSLTFFSFGVAGVCLLLPLGWLSSAQRPVRLFGCLAFVRSVSLLILSFLPFASSEFSFTSFWLAGVCQIMLLVSHLVHYFRRS